MPCVQPIVVAIFHKVKSSKNQGTTTTHYTLDDVRVRPSFDSSSKAILSQGHKLSEDEYRKVGRHGRSNIHPGFLDSAPGILKTVDLDVQFAGGPRKHSGASSMV